MRPERALWREESLPRGSFCVSSWGACVVPGPTRALGTQGTESWLLPSPGWQSSGTGRQVTGDQETRVPVGGGAAPSGPGLWEEGARSFRGARRPWPGPRVLRAERCPSFPSPRAQLKLRQELASKGGLKCGLEPKNL